MDHPGENPNPPQKRPHAEYEDPHFHDDQDFEAPAEDGKPLSERPQHAKNPSRRILPPKRRFVED